MSLESDRRASGAAMEASRRASGVAMEASRRSGGSTLKRDLNSLESGARKVAELTKVEAKGARPARTGVAYYTPPANSGGGGGLAGPFTEPDYAARTYWDYKTMTSQDGLLTFYVQPIKQVTMEDVVAAEVVFNFDEPAP